MLDSRELTKSWSTILLLTIGFAFSLFYLHSISRWWFEDDPIQFYYVAQIKNVFDIFTDPQIIRGFGAGKALVPMQILSYWIDVKFFAYNPMAAYIHNLISFLLTLLALHNLIFQLTRNKFTSFVGGLLWMILPSTIAVYQFLSSRHYIEGLFFFILFCYFTKRFFDRDNERILYFVLLIIFGIISILFKEIYAALIPAIFLLSGILKRNYLFIFLSIAIALCYALYRFWVIGPDVSYTMPFLNGIEYLHYLVIFPYTFSANKGGYLIYTTIVLLTILFVKRYKSTGIQKTVFFFLVLCAGFISIYPVAYIVLIIYETPGTWYRVPFIINTLLVIWGSYVWSQTLSVKYNIGLLIVLLIVLPGTVITRQYWNNHLDRAEIEGKFYIENSDKLMYSEEDADWFIVGVHKMYNIPEEHYINKQSKSSDHARLMISKYTTIWRYQDGYFLQDDNLYKEIKQENSQN